MNNLIFQLIHPWLYRSNFFSFNLSIFRVNIIQYHQLKQNMENFTLVQEKFIQIGYQQTSLLTKKQLLQALDQLTLQNVWIEVFNRDLAEQIWEETLNFQAMSLAFSKLHNHRFNKNQRVCLANIVRTICEAYRILQQYIKQLQKYFLEAERKQANMLKTNNSQQKDQKAPSQDDKQYLQKHYDHLIALFTTYSEYKLLRECFRITLPSKTQMIGLKKPLKVLDNILETINIKQLNPQTQFIKKKHTNLFAIEASSLSIDPHNDLIISMLLCFLMLLLDMLLIYQKNNFYSLLACLQVSSIYLLNYFDKFYVRATILILVATSTMDIIWLIAKTKIYFYPKSETTLSLLQNNFLVFVIVGTFVACMFKMLQIAMIIKYRDNDHDSRKVIEILMLRISLDGSGNRNPYSLLFNIQSQ